MEWSEYENCFSYTLLRKCFEWKNQRSRELHTCFENESNKTQISYQQLPKQIPKLNPRYGAVVNYVH